MSEVKSGVRSHDPYLFTRKINIKKNKAIKGYFHMKTGPVGVQRNPQLITSLYIMNTKFKQ